MTERLRPVATTLLLAAIAPVAVASGEAASTTLGALSRRAQAIVVARWNAAGPGDLARFLVLDALRGPAPGSILEVRATSGVSESFEPVAAREWLLYLRGSALASGWEVLGGARGAIPLSDDEAWETLQAARSWALRADLPDAAYRDFLLLALASRADRLRQDAAVELRALPPALRATIPAESLVQALRQQNGFTTARAALLSLLGAVPSAAAAKALATEGLEGPEPALPLVGTALREHGPNGSSALLPALEFESPAARRRAAALFEFAPSAAATPRLARLAREDADPRVRLAALRALAVCAGSPPADDLAYLALSAPPAERRAAARALYLRGGASEVEWLRDRAREDSALRPLLDALARDPFAPLDP